MAVKTTITMKVESIGGDGQVLAQLTTEQADVVSAVLAAARTAVDALTDPGEIAAHNQHLSAVEAYQA